MFRPLSYCIQQALDYFCWVDFNINQIIHCYNMAEFFQPFLIYKHCRKPALADKKTILQEKPYKKNSWTLQEHKDYVRFFSENRDFIERNLVRKSEKIFIRMTDYITTRNAVQIKSHHQKLLLKYGSIMIALQKLQEQIKKSLEGSSKLHIDLKSQSPALETESLKKTQPEIRAQLLRKLKTMSEGLQLDIALQLSDPYIFDILSWPEPSSSQLGYL